MSCFSKLTPQYFDLPFFVSDEVFKITNLVYLICELLHYFISVSFIIYSFERFDLVVLKLNLLLQSIILLVNFFEVLLQLCHLLFIHLCIKLMYICAPSVV